ncbi:MAG TPA: hypothetical protein VMY77_02460 [Chitinophagaceae bacterium]|nr:hypothetical protein [Chitinophagaceae bacterium]
MKKIFVFLFCICTLSTIAQDRYFARTYTSHVLPKGAIDLEFWHTSRLGRANQFFHAQDQRMEVEFGLGRNVLTAFYFNHFQNRVSTGLNGTATSHQIGFSNEWKFKLSDPSANKIGSALYFEAGIKGGDEVELETKIILDKYVGKSLFAFNGVAEFEKEFEWENGSVESEGWSTPIEFDLAYMYNVKPTFGLGLEIVNKNDIAKGKGWKNSIFYAGPTVNFRSGKWFVIVNYLPQLGNIHKTIYSPGNKVLDDHERAEARILLGISL